MGALRDQLTDLWRARELLRQLVSKELKVRYKDSVLGFLWSMLTPVAMTVVFTVIFQFAVGIRVDDFAAFLVSGYLVWQFFQTSVHGASQSIVSNGALIKKVYFPREVLPLSIVLSQLTHLLLALLAVGPYLVATRGPAVLTHLPAALLGIALLLVFTAGVTMLFAGANVPFRDLEELKIVLFMVWFYATPVVYPLALVESAENATARAFTSVLEANPMTWFVGIVRDALFGPVTSNPDCATLAPGRECLTPFLVGAPAWPEPGVVAAAAVAAAGTFTIGYRVFHRLALTFAKEV